MRYFRIENEFEKAGVETEVNGLTQTSVFTLHRHVLKEDEFEVESLVAGNYVTPDGVELEPEEIFIHDHQNCFTF